MMARNSFKKSSFPEFSLKKTKLAFSYERRLFKVCVLQNIIMLSIAFLANYFSLMLPKMHKSLQVAESLSNAP